MKTLDPEFVEDVYDSLCGQLEEEYRIPWVEDHFREGSYCSEKYEQMRRAYDRLLDRLRETDEDPDAEVMINSLLDIARYMGLRMFECGVKYAREYE